MNQSKLTKDQLQKIGLSIMGFIVLLYIYFSFFLGPLNRSRNSMLKSIGDKQNKIDSSKSELTKAAALEQQAKAATARFASLKALNAEGAPIAWFPPRMRLFFANQQIDKAVARLESTGSFKQPELAAWAKYNWLVDLPQADYGVLGRAIAELENTEPLLAISKLSIHTLPDQPQFQQIVLTVTNVIQKK